MPIEYERTVEITYEQGKMQDTDFKKLVGELAKQDMYVCGNYDNYRDNKYGYNTRQRTQRVYSIHSPEHDRIMAVDYQSDAIAIVDGLAHIIDGIEMVEEKTITIKKEWIEPNGSYVALASDERFDGDSVRLNEWGENSMEYSNGVTMSMRVKNQYDGLQLGFVIQWNVDTIQRKDKIEEAMVQTVMDDMGKIQSIFEGRLNLKKFGYNTEEVSVDCHFDVKTESRSECTPDIIRQVRDARKEQSE